MEKFQLRLNCIDHYQANPTDLDPPLPLSDGSHPQKIRPKVPVIRVFGATETGQKVCAHVHGALPYLYVEYRGDLAPEEGQCLVLSHHRDKTEQLQWIPLFVLCIYQLTMLWRSAIVGTRMIPQVFMLAI